MRWFLIAVYIAAWAAEVLCVYRFMYKDKSLKCKAIASTVFLVAGGIALFLPPHVLSFSSPEPTRFTVLILIALAASWIGDVTLDFKIFGMKGIVGILFFMSAHILYIAAFSSRLSEMGGSFFEVSQIIPWAALMIVELIILFKMKIELGAVTIPVIVYAGVINCMVVKAVALGIKYLAGDYAPQSRVITLSVILILASVMFLVSDIGVCMMMFGGKKDLPIGKKVYSLDNFNLVTYYGAQMLFGASIIFNWIVPTV